jgi:hypothetical protein
MADSTGPTGLRKFEVAFNNCVRFAYDLRCYDHVSEYNKNILGCSLSDCEYYEFRACGLHHAKRKYFIQMLWYKKILKIFFLKYVAFCIISPF